MRQVKILSGWYRVSGQHYYSNVKRDGRFWYADLRYSHSGELRQHAGLWSRKRDAIEEAERLIAYHDPLFIEGDLN